MSLGDKMIYGPEHQYRHRVQVSRLELMTHLAEVHKIRVLGDETLDELSRLHIDAHAALDPAPTPDELELLKAVRSNQGRIITGVTTVFEWEGVLDPTHTLGWLTEHALAGTIPTREHSALLGPHGISWEIPPADDSPLWLKLMSESDVVAELGGKRVRVTVEVIDS